MTKYVRRLGISTTSIEGSTVALFLRTTSIRSGRPSVTKILRGIGPESALHCGATSVESNGFGSIHVRPQLDPWFPPGKLRPKMGAGPCFRHAQKRVPFDKSEGSVKDKLLPRCFEHRCLCQRG